MSTNGSTSGDNDYEKMLAAVPDVTNLEGIRKAAQGVMATLVRDLRSKKLSSREEVRDLVNAKFQHVAKTPGEFSILGEIQISVGVLELTPAVDPRIGHGVHTLSEWTQLGPEGHAYMVRMMFAEENNLLTIQIWKKRETNYRTTVDLLEETN